jgi:hypothetical protein
MTKKEPSLTELFHEMHQMKEELLHQAHMQKDIREILYDVNSSLANLALAEITRDGKNPSQDQVNTLMRIISKQARVKK